MKYIIYVLRSSVSLLKGLKLTFKTMLLPSITVRYPTEKLVPYPSFRGLLLYDAEKCLACGMCARTCPSNCISFTKAADGTGRLSQKVDWFSIDYGKCNFCGLCEEACPTKPRSLWHSLDYEAVFNTREEMVRFWKQGVNLWGTVYNHRKNNFLKVAGQTHIQDVPVRK